MNWKEKMEFLEKQEIDKEVKLYMIMDALHEQQITYKKALELCTEIGIFSEHWIGIDAKMVEQTTKK